jgi:hypothetical protein
MTQIREQSSTPAEVTYPMLDQLQSCQTCEGYLAAAAAAAKCVRITAAVLQMQRFQAGWQVLQLHRMTVIANSNQL